MKENLGELVAAEYEKSVSTPASYDRDLLIRCVNLIVKEHTKTQQMPLDLPKKLDTPEFRAAWDEWVQHRKEKKVKLTPTAISRQIAQCVAWGHDLAIASIRKSIMCGYTGLFEARQIPQGLRPTGPRNNAVNYKESPL